MNNTQGITMDLWPQQQAAAWIPDLSLLACNSMTVCKLGCTGAAALVVWKGESFLILWSLGVFQKTEKGASVNTDIQLLNALVGRSEGLTQLLSNPGSIYSVLPFMTCWSHKTELLLAALLPSVYPLFPLKGGYIFIQGSFSWLSFRSKFMMIQINHF